MSLRILLHSLNYAPELVGVGKYSGELGEFLAEQGHDVRVAAAPPYYPQWEVQPGYEGRKYRTEVLQGVRVLRCPCWVPPTPTALKRMVHLASFGLSSAPAVLTQVGWKPDAVVSVAPTLFAAPASLAAARLAGAARWLHIQDFELDTAAGLRLLPGPLARLGVRAESLLLRRFDRVSTISNAMRRRLIDKGVDSEKAWLFPNWVDMSAIYPRESCPSPLREDLGADADATLVLYSGNLGNKQGLETLIEAAGFLADDASLRFVIAGEGSAKERLRHVVAERRLSNLLFLPLQPADCFNDLLNAADIHVLTERKGASDAVMPSKVGAMLASGRPVILTVSPGTALGRTVTEAGAGILTPPEDPWQLAQAIRSLAGQKAAARAMGAAGRRYAEHCLDKRRILSRFLGELEELVQERNAYTRSG